MVVLLSLWERLHKGPQSQLNWNYYKEGLHKGPQLQLTWYYYKLMRPPDGILITLMKIANGDRNPLFKAICNYIASIFSLILRSSIYYALIKFFPKVFLITLAMVTNWKKIHYKRLDLHLYWIPYLKDVWTELSIFKQILHYVIHGNKQILCHLLWKSIKNILISSV